MSKPRRTTAADVAAAVGVSRSTVSFVLNNTPGQKISAAVRGRVLSEAARLDYRPHPAARALVSGSSRVVLIPLPEWPVEYALRQILDEASTALDEAGYALVTTSPHHSGHARPLWETLRPDVVLPIEPLPPAERAAITAFGVRIVESVPENMDAATDSVDLQIDHLIERGHRRIAFASTMVAGMAGMNDARRERAERRCAARGAAFTHATIDETRAQNVVKQWSAEGFTAAAAFNDDTAALAVGAALRLGLRVPHDLAVIGHDDTPLASLIVPSLTTIRFDTTGLGRDLAARAIAAAAGDPLPSSEPLLADARVIEREST